jgi:RNA polymerase sigma-70 factor, ECF subfamily
LKGNVSEADAQLRSLLSRAQAGDGRAFAALVRQFDHGMRALAFRLVGDHGMMEDALQEAYLKAFRALPRFRGEASFGTWLYRIVYNACVDELKRAKRSVGLPLEEVSEKLEGAPDPGETLSVKGAVRGALMGLPPEERAAVALVDGQGLRYAEAAAVLGLPVGTVASRLNRAREALRSALGDPGEAREGRASP